MPACPAAHSGGMDSYGLILSSASETAGPFVSGSFLTRASAVAGAEMICRAQPGIEYEIVRRASVRHCWCSETQETAREVIDRRWA
jgi:hypothetical protein